MLKNYGQLLGAAKCSIPSSKGVILVLGWVVFVIGMTGCAILVIPIAAYQLFSALLEEDYADELNSGLRR